MIIRNVQVLARYRKVGSRSPILSTPKGFFWRGRRYDTLAEIVEKLEREGYEKET